MVTIIVPFYNVEQYFSECLESIAAQTYKEFEVLLVDSGSTDNSLKIARSMAKKDKRFKILHDGHNGAGSARNVGLKHAKGDYVMFVDADDVVSKEILRELKAIEADVVIMQNKKFTDKPTFKKDSDVKYISGEQAIIDMCCFQIQSGPVARLIKKNLIKNIRFISASVGEDLWFNYEVFSNAKVIAVSQSVMYGYRQNMNSLTHSPYNVRKNDSIKVGQKLVTKSKGSTPTFQQAARARLASEAMFTIETIMFDEMRHSYRKNYTQTLKILRRNLPSLLLSSSPIKLKVMAILSSINPHLYISILKIKGGSA